MLFRPDGGTAFQNNHPEGPVGGAAGPQGHWGLKGRAPCMNFIHRASRSKIKGMFIKCAAL